MITETLVEGLERCETKSCLSTPERNRQSSSVSQKNRVVRLSGVGGPDALALVQEPARQPAAGEVRLRVHAIGLNRAEVMYRTGMYTETPQPPARIGSEASGVIEALGRDSTQTGRPCEYLSRVFHEPIRRVG